MPSCPWSRPSAGPTGRWASLRSFPARCGGPMWRTWVSVLFNTHLAGNWPVAAFSKWRNWPVAEWRNWPCSLCGGVLLTTEFTPRLCTRAGRVTVVISCTSALAAHLLVVRLAFRVGTVNGHRSRARRAALRLALRRAHDATSFCHLGPFCHLKPFCHLVSPRRVATTRPPNHPPRGGGGGGSTPLPPATLASPAARPVPHTATHPLLLLHYSTSIY